MITSTDHAEQIIGIWQPLNKSQKFYKQVKKKNPLSDIEPWNQKFALKTGISMFVKVKE
jgi:hypothetical protein